MGMTSFSILAYVIHWNIDYELSKKVNRMCLTKKLIKNKKIEIKNLRPDTYLSVCFSRTIPFSVLYDF